MKRTLLLFIICSAPRATAQTPARATTGGVYSAPQAERGRVAYAGFCRSCHSPASHSGTTFEKIWKGKTLGDLFGYLTAQMPKNDPGSLNPDQYADVMAYLLKMNALPAGKIELPADSAQLASIRIELPAKKNTAPRAHPTTRKKGA
ncbi:MAG: hypothetical protein JWM95_657 [Gemmatimonadetes bacterium]|nr:hypothetical protein [Gemmatimonadota bacterium]